MIHYLNITDGFANTTVATAPIIDLATQYRNDYIVGFHFMLPALPGLILYIPVMIVLMNPCHQKDFSYSFYIIVKSLGFADISALVCWLLVAIHTLTHGNLFSNQVVAFLFWHSDIAWVVLVWHLVLMSVNRYVAIRHMNHVDTIFSTPKTLIMIVVVYLVAWLVLMPFIFPCCQMKFSFMGYCIQHNTAMIWYKIWQNFDFVEFPLAFVICCGSHLMVALKYRAVKRAAHSQQNNSNKKKDNKEFRMFIQTVMVCLAFSISDLLYYTVWLGTSDIWINFFTGMWLWEINYMISPIIYLIFNPSIRSKAISMRFGRMFTNRTNTTVVSMSELNNAHQLLERGYDSHTSTSLDNTCNGIMC